MADPVAIRRVQRIGNDPNEAMLEKSRGICPNRAGEQDQAKVGRVNESESSSTRRKRIGHRNALVETTMNVIALGPSLWSGPAQEHRRSRRIGGTPLDRIFLMRNA
jgi:hypothetical protein